MTAKDLIHDVALTLKTPDVSGISLRMIREYDAEQERRESLERAAQERQLLLLIFLMHCHCASTVH